MVHSKTTIPHSMWRCVATHYLHPILFLHHALGIPNFHCHLIGLHQKHPSIDPPFPFLFLLQALLADHWLTLLDGVFELLVGPFSIFNSFCIPFSLITQPAMWCRRLSSYDHMDTNLFYAYIIVSGTFWFLRQLYIYSVMSSSPEPSGSFSCTIVSTRCHSAPPMTLSMPSFPMPSFPSIVQYLRT